MQGMSCQLCEKILVINEDFHPVVFNLFQFETSSLDQLNRLALARVKFKGWIRIEMNLWLKWLVHWIFVALMNYKFSET